MRNYHRAWFVALLVFVLSILIYAQEPWKDKPFSQWDKNDIEKIAGDSPWARTQQEDPGIGNKNPQALMSAVTIRLRSALPIRQALLRLKQIEAKYDKMSAADRAAFDSKNKGILDCPACADNYVISIGPPIINRQMASGVLTLKHDTLGTLQRRVYLTNELGERRDIVHFVAPKTESSEAMIFFPRLDAQGKPLINATSKKLILHFEPGNQGFVKDAVPSITEFSVPRMIINGEVAF